MDKLIKLAIILAAVVVGYVLVYFLFRSRMRRFHAWVVRVLFKGKEKAKEAATKAVALVKKDTA